MMQEIKQLQQKVASLEKEHLEYLLLNDTNQALHSKVSRVICYNVSWPP